MDINTTALEKLIKQAIVEHKLPANFHQTVHDYYLPLASELMAKPKSKGLKTPLLLGIQGTQGSGKSTCAAFMKLILESQFQKRTLVISIDDFYLTLNERQALAQEVHPLLVTRGVPGTHDVALLIQTLNQCADLNSGDSIAVPVFDKARDDRAETDQWQTITQAVDIIILEGWCVGLPAQAETELTNPINQLEGSEDSQQLWRNFVNHHLATDYHQLFSRLDYLIAVQAPSFDCVFEWRLLQEKKLAEKLKKSGQDASNIQTEDQLRRFISHYERLTRHALDWMPTHADWLLILRQDHSFSKLITNN